MATESEQVTIAADCLVRLRAALEADWAERSADWDERVEDNAPTDDHIGSWNLPCIDSKDVARMAPIFEKHLEVRFDVKHIRPGGYSEIAEVCADLVPKLTGCELPATFTANANGGSHDERSTS